MYVLGISCYYPDAAAALLRTPILRRGLAFLAALEFEQAPPYHFPQRPKPLDH